LFGQLGNANSGMLSEASRPEGRRFPGRYLLLYCALNSALKGGACGVLAGQKEKPKDEKYFRGKVTKRVPPAHFVNSHKSKTSIEIN
jgi:hypothetical protein